MPLPSSSDPGKIIKFLKADKPGMGKQKRTAIALNQARKNGARIPRNETLNTLRRRSNA